MRNWLQTHLRPARRPLTSARTLQLRYFRFRRDLPYMCRDQGTTVPQLTFLDYRLNVRAWIAESPVAGS